MSIPMKPSDPAYWMLFDDFTTTPEIHRSYCYICNDPEFAQMGLPLCRICPRCEGHIAADDTGCDDCGFDEIDEHFGFRTVQDILTWFDEAPAALIKKLSNELGGYSLENQEEILRGDYSHVSTEDIEIFRAALACF